MNTEEVIDSYVADVVKRLPRRQRIDVGQELRSLLREDLGPQPEGVLEYLRAFGRPAEVAARYGRTITVIDSADSRLFLRTSVIGIAVVWLAGALVVAQEGGEHWAQQWWFSAGLPALWWPGLLVVCFAGAAWARQRWPQLAEWKPRPVDRDHVSRLGYGAAVVGAVLGTFVLATPIFLLDKVFNASTSAQDAFEYSAGFTLGPAVLALLVAQILLLTAIMIRGRWETITRRLDVAVSIAMCALLTWVLLAGDIYQSEPTNETARFALVVIVVSTLISLVRKLRNVRLRSAFTPTT
jgi:hypothetical protein